MIPKLVYLISFLVMEQALSIGICYVDDIHALILARGGSKGIKHKNLAEFNGMTLLGRAINTIKQSGLFQYIWISTDSEEIADEAGKHGALLHRRSKLFAMDETSSLESVKEFLSTHPTINRIALFQCTSVFLKERYIAEAFHKFQSSECVFSVTRSHKLRWTKANGKLFPLNFNATLRPRRQDWDGELIETGMFYFSSRKLIDRNTFQNERCSFVEVNALDALEIDTHSDLILAQCMDNVTKEAAPLKTYSFRREAKNCFCKYK